MSRRKRVALTGATGQLGRAVIKHAPEHWEIFGSSTSEIDLRNWPAVRDWIAWIRPQVVIHAGAMTDVDGCETNVDEAFGINALGTRHVAQAAGGCDATLVYVSTNFIFDGHKANPYHEFDIPNPISVYGESKLAGEREALQARAATYIVRTAMVYDETGRNFVNTMRRLMTERTELKVVNDQRGNPTYAGDLALGIGEILDRCPPGTYHLTNHGAASWYEWACEIRELASLDSKIDPIEGKDFQRAATPPANGVLASLALASSGISLPDWRDALRRCLA